MKKKYYDDNALNNIFDKYPRIEPGKVTLFAPVYYPIAMVEMDLKEETYQNFDPINEVIMKMKSLGVIGIPNISVATGLSEGYISKIQNILISDGLLDENGLITEQGKKSVLASKKIITKRNTKVFQVDSINRNIIAVDNRLIYSTLEDKKDISSKGACILPREGIDTSILERNLVAGDYEAIVGRKRDVLRTNLIEVEDARFSEMKYAKCFLLKHGGDEPIIFAKVYSRNEIGSYVWKPMFVLSKQQINTFGFDDATSIADQAAYDVISGTYNTIKENQKVQRDRAVYAKRVLNARNTGSDEPEYLDDKVKSKIENIANLKTDTFYFMFNEERDKYTVEVYLDSFSRTYSFIEFVVNAAKYGEQIIAAPSFMGYVVSIKTRDAAVQELIDLISEKLENQDKQELLKQLKRIFRKSPLNEEVLAQMICFVRDGTVPERPEESEDE